MIGAHPAAGARSRRVQPRHAQPADRHGPAARRDEIQRPHLHRLDGHGRGRQAAVAGRGGGARDQGRQRHRAALAGRCRGGGRDQGGGGEGRDSAWPRSTHPCGVCCARRRGSACTRSGSCRWTTCRRTSAAARTARVAQEIEQATDHADQGRSQSGAAARAARRVGAVPVRARLSVELAHRRAEPDVPARAAPAVAGGDGHRAVGSIDDRRRSISCRASAPRYDAIVVSVFVRAASGSGRMDLAPPLVTAAERSRARRPRARRRPLMTVFFGNPYVPGGRALAAGDAADVRLLRSRRAVGGSRARRRRADHRPAADRDARHV